MVQKLRDVGIWVSPGRSHHMPEYAKGWARITFALEAKEIDIALGRMRGFFDMEGGRKVVPSSA